jgi:hypothetical protein
VLAVLDVAIQEVEAVGTIAVKKEQAPNQAAKALVFERGKMTLLDLMVLVRRWWRIVVDAVGDTAVERRRVAVSVARLHPVTD